MQAVRISAEGIPASGRNSFSSFVGVHRRKIRKLSDGRNHHVHRNQGLRAFHGHGATSAAGVRLAELHLDVFQLVDLTISTKESNRSGQKMELDSLFLSTMDFFGTGGHFITRASVNYGHSLSAHAHAVAGCVDGNVATADYGNVLAYVNRLAQCKINQKVHARPNTLEVLSHDAQFSGIPCADGKNKGVVSLLPE